MRAGGPTTRASAGRSSGGASTPSSAPNHPTRSPRFLPGSPATALRCRRWPKPLPPAGARPGNRPTGWEERGREHGTAAPHHPGQRHGLRGRAGLLDTNPIRALKWTAPKVSSQVDRRSVVNPRQARALLEAVRAQQPSGPRLVAFFAVMYYAGLRPEEAINLSADDVILRASWLRSRRLGRTAHPRRNARRRQRVDRRRQPAGGDSSSTAPRETAGSCPPIPS